VAVLPPPLRDYYPIECTDFTAAILPKLDEFDSVWELANDICDRYFKSVAA